MKPTVAVRQHVVNAEDEPPSRTPAGDAFTTLLGQVIGLTRRFTTAGEALAKPAGQTLARWLVLETIQDKPATVAQIGRTLHLARQGVQRLADVLVRDDLAAYEDNPPTAGPSSCESHRTDAAPCAPSDGPGSVGRCAGGQIGEEELRQARSGWTGCCKLSAATLPMRRLPTAPNAPAHVAFVALVVCPSSSGLMATGHRDQASTKQGSTGLVQTTATAAAGPQEPSAAAGRARRSAAAPLAGPAARWRGGE